MVRRVDFMPRAGSRRVTVEVYFVDGTSRVAYDGTSHAKACAVRERYIHALERGLARTARPLARPGATGARLRAIARAESFACASFCMARAHMIPNARSKGTMRYAGVGCAKCVKRELARLYSTAFRHGAAAQATR